MLIVENQNEQDLKNFDEHQESRNKKHKGKNSHYCLKSCGCLVIIIAVIITIIFFSFKFFISPAIVTIDKLPEDFPKEVVLSNIDKAKIKIQTPEQKEKLEKIIGYLPKSIGSYLNNFLAINNKASTTTNTSSSDSSVENDKTVSVSWTALDRKKEELLDFYKKQLLNKNFNIRETITKNNINLNFWKDGTSGVLDLNDSPTKENSSDANIIINYQE